MNSDATEHKVQVPPQSHSLPETNAVSLKLPIFWPKDPIIWFAQTEAHFNARNITAEQTKFIYWVTSLDQDTALRVKDLLLTGPTSNPYTILKTRLIEIFTLSLGDRANKLLSIKSLGLIKLPRSIPTSGLRRRFLRSPFPVSSTETSIL